MTRFLTAAILFLVLAAPCRANTIFSNLGPGDTYDCCHGEFVQGPQTLFDLDVGAPFIPLDSFTLDFVDIALTWFSDTPNAGDVWLMSDAGGLPDLILESFHFENLPEFFTTDSTLATGVSTTHPLLSAGVQYWVVASTDGETQLIFNSNITGDMGCVRRRDSDEGDWGECFEVGEQAGAFRVRGTPAVPEPASVLLFGIGGVALLGRAVATRKRARAERPFRTMPPLNLERCQVAFGPV
jgi:hypothetical protein